MARRTKAEIADEIDAMLKVFDDFPDVEDLPFEDKKLPRGKMVQIFRSYLAAVQRTHHALIAHQTCVAEERAALAAAHPIVLRIRLFLRTRVGPKSPLLQNYGVQPLREGKKTVDVKLRAIEKAQETRKLRRTMGRKQRRAIKG
ncbi:MAG TPA: hypothetical protein VGY54_27500 [Polyangiaceae bacterium]|jgi:hypothetical protein|nr:hypothetical protein [Polyangiaceae bacterium]